MNALTKNNTVVDFGAMPRNVVRDLEARICVARHAGREGVVLRFGDILDIQERGRGGFTKNISTWGMYLHLYQYLTGAGFTATFSRDAKVTDVTLTIRW